MEVLLKEEVVKIGGEEVELREEMVREKEGYLKKGKGCEGEWYEGKWGVGEEELWVVESEKE